MRLGLFSMPLHPPERSIADTYADDFATIELAEQLGYEEFWVGEHFTSVWENIPAPDMFIAQAAGRTRTINFGTGVVLMPFHNPLHVALRLSQLDHQTRGRLLVGVGSGGLTDDKKAFGIDPTPEQAGKTTREGIEMILKCWRGESFELNPRTLVGVPHRPYQVPHPPIAIAGVNRTSYGLGGAGERGWIPMSTNFLPPPVLADHWKVYSEGAARAGRQPDSRLWRVARDVHVAETTEQARREVREGGMWRAYSDYMFPLVGGTRGLAIFKSDEAMPDSAVTVDYMMDNVWIVGSVDECVAKLSALGDFGYLLQVAHDWAPYQDRFHRSMELLATKVIPAVNS